MTLPHGLIHHWDPSVDPTGPYLKDTVGSVDGLLGRHDRGTFDSKAPYQVRSHPSGFSVCQFLGGQIVIPQNREMSSVGEANWTDQGASIGGSVYEVRSPYYMKYTLPSAVPSGNRVACGGKSLWFGALAAGDKWLYMDLWFQWPYLRFPDSGIVKLVAFQAGGEETATDKIWFGLEPARDALGNIDARYNDMSDVEMYGCFYMPDGTKVERNVNTTVQIQRWNVNRIQMFVKLGIGDGAAQLYVNEVLVLNQTSLTIGAEAGWDYVEITPVWGQIGDGNYEDVWRYGGDSIYCHHVWPGHGNPISPSWPSHSLHENEPDGFVPINECSFDAAWDPVVQYTEEYIARIISPGYFGSDRNLTYPVRNDYANPLINVSRPHERFGAGTDRLFHKAGSTGTMGTWFAGGQLTGKGAYTGGASYCHTNFPQHVYACMYFKMGKAYSGAVHGEWPDWVEQRHPILQFFPFKGSYTYLYGPGTIGLEINYDPDHFRESDYPVYVGLWSAADGQIGGQQTISRDKTYKLEIEVEIIGDYGQNQNNPPTQCFVKWWLNENMVYTGEYDPLTHDNQVGGPLYDNELSGVRWVGRADEEFQYDGHLDVYYVYMSADPVGFHSSPPETRGDWHAPQRSGNWLDCNVGGYLNDSNLGVYAVEHVRLPIDKDDGFWVGEDRHDYAMMFVLQSSRQDKLDMLILDSYDDAFKRSLPSIVWAGASAYKAKGLTGSTSGGVAGKIQFTFSGYSWITITDTPGSGPHSLVIVVSRYTRGKVSFYLDGVLVYEENWTPEYDGRWFANTGNNVARNGDETNGDVMLFGDCIAGAGRLDCLGEDYWRNYCQGDTGQGGSHELNFRGGFIGQAGQVLFWDRAIMPEEVKEAHEHLRLTYTTLPVAVPTTDTPTTPASWTFYEIENNIMFKLFWAASTDPGGVALRYEVESSTTGGASWQSFRTVDDIEPGTVAYVRPSTRNFGFGNVRFRVRAYNGINYSGWLEGTDLEVTKWPALLARSPARAGRWWDGVTQYPGSRLADEYACINADGVTYDLTQDGVSEYYRPKPEFYIAFEAAPGDKITAIHFLELKVENNIDYIDIWVWDEDWQSWEYLWIELARLYQPNDRPFLQRGWWKEHWALLDPDQWLDNPTKIGFGLVTYEHNSWYPDQRTTGFAVDMVFSGGKPESEEEDAPPVSIQGGCADYEVIWLHAPILNDMETGFIPGDTHQFARQVKGFGALTIVGDAALEIARFVGENPVFIAKTITPFDNGDGSYDFQLMLTEAETASIGYKDAYHYQLRFTLSDGSVTTPNAGLIKGVPFDVVV